ncbi:MAG: alpha/beta fold hydrolase [Dehalococcoidia bacterium]
MERVVSRDGTMISFERTGEGPPLVLVHGGFSDHMTNWASVKPLLQADFRVTALARRGRGETDRTDGHSLADEAADVAAVIEAEETPVLLLGHSYGALCALDAAALVPDRIAKLVLYEPPWPNALSDELVTRMEGLGSRREWDALVEVFLIDGLQVPPDDVAALRRSAEWSMWTDDAEASLGDMRALVRHTVVPERYRTLTMPALLLAGTESPRDLYLTDALLANLPNARAVDLDGQAHEGMTTAPDQFVDAIAPFLLAGEGGGHLAELQRRSM